MAKLTFPSAPKPYQGILSAMRQPLLAWARLAQREPKARPYIIAQIGALVNTLTTIILANATAVNVKNSAGTKTVAGTANVSAGTLNSIDLPASAALITSAQALTGVTPTGSFVTTVTFTVTAGVISAIVLS